MQSMPGTMRIRVKIMFAATILTIECSRRSRALIVNEERRQRRNVVKRTASNHSVDVEDALLFAFAPGLCRRMTIWGVIRLGLSYAVGFFGMGGVELEDAAG